MRLRFTTPACVLGVLLVSAGCGSAQNDAVEGAATRFEAAGTVQDSTAAVGPLAPGTRSEVESSGRQACVEAWADQGVPPGGEVTRVRTYGSMAIVDLQADTLFLGRFDGRWRVVAARCAKRADKPYECQVKGG